MSNRIRCLVLGLVFGSIFMFSHRPAAAHDDPDAQNTESRFEVTELAPDLLMLSTDQGSYSNNSLVFHGSDGLLLVDTHHDSDAEEFKKYIDALGFGPPKIIISTHRHVEHIGGNALWGAAPIIIGHHLLPERLRSGSYLFSEYPPETFPDITFTGSMEIQFNGETIRLQDIGGSHDDNEIMVHFVNHRLTHISSVVNGFNFPSIDSDGDLFKFEDIVRQLMELLPKDVRLVSGHHGKVKGFDVVGSWDMLEPYADMMQASVEKVRAALASGTGVEEMVKSKLLGEFESYAGSYVGLDEWTESVAEALSKPKERRKDVYKVLFETWKTKDAEAAVRQYTSLLDSASGEYDFNEFVLLAIGSKLLSRGLNEDAIVFLRGNLETYPTAKYAYYTHYLVAKNLNELGRPEEAIEQCNEAIRLNPEFAGATELLEKIRAQNPE